MRDDNNNYRDNRTNQEKKENNMGRILMGLATLAVLAGLGKYILDRNNEATNGQGNNILGLQVGETPTPTIDQSFQTITVSMTAGQLTNWISKGISPDLPISNLQTTIQGSQALVSGQSTSSVLPGAFTATIQPANNPNDIVAVTRVNREGTDVSAATLSIINSGVNTAIENYLNNNNLTVSNMNIANGQITMDMTGPTERLNQIMNGR